MNLLPAPLRVVLLLPLACAVLQAELVWEATTRETRADFGQEQIAVTFPFRNAGSGPVTIASIDVSCGCTVPTLEQRTYAPGERGELKIVYRPDGQTGLQSKAVTVKIDGEPARPVTLTLKVDVPRLFDIAPRLVTWPLGGEPVEKLVSIKLHRNPQTAVRIANPEIDTLAVSLRAGEATGEHILALRPKSTAQPFRAMVRLHISSEGLPDQVLAVYADLR
jgi:hypothetical protein